MTYYHSWAYYNKRPKKNRMWILMCIIIPLLYMFYTHVYHVKKEPILNKKEPIVKVINIVSTSSKVEIIKTIAPSKFTFDRKNRRIHRYLTASEKSTVLKMVADAKLNIKEAECLIEHESTWDSEGILANEMFSIDRGLWAINSKWHFEVSSSCAFDIICSTKEAIRIRKANGDWNQWSGYVNNCL